MVWVVAILSAITALCVIGWIHAAMNVKTAEDNWDVVALAACAGFFGLADLVMIIIWLAIT